MIFSKRLIPKLVEYFIGTLGMYKAKRGWLRAYTCPCPRKKKNKFGINLFKNKTSCFICGSLEPPIEYAMKYEDIDTFEQFKTKLNLLGGIEFLEPPGELRKYKKVKLPESFTLLSFGKNQYGKSARSYMRNRGYDILDLTIKGIGYCTQGKYSGFIIFPWYRSGELIYYTGRKFIGDRDFLNPPTEDFDVGKTQMIHNIDALFLYKKVYIVESITNELTLPSNTIAIGGKIISPWQITAILDSPVKFLVILLDPDAYQEALEISINLSKYKKVKMVKLPEGKDVNDLGKKQTLELVKNTPYRESPDYQNEYWNYEKKYRYTP